MAVFKAVVRFKRPDGFYPVYIRVTHQRKDSISKLTRWLTRRVDKSNGIKDPYVMKYCANKISRFVEIFNKQDISSWTVDEVVNYLKSGTADICFSDYAREYQSKMIQEGHARNARTYELAYHLQIRNTLLPRRLLLRNKRNVLNVNKLGVNSLKIRTYALFL